MQFSLPQLFLVFLLLSSVNLFGDGSERKIRLLGNTKANTPKTVSIKEIEELGLVQENIYNPYEKRTDLYTGVLLDKFIKKYANDDVKTVTFTAIDDYEVVMPKSQYSSEKIILATRINKHYMSLRSKGPLRIVYPDYDAKKKKYQVNLSYWIWMITKIKFK